MKTPVVAAQNMALIADMDNLFRELIAEARGSTVPSADDAVAPDDAAKPPLAFLDRLKVFAEGTRWVAVRNKLQTEDTPDEFGQLAERFHNRGGKGGRPRNSTKVGANADTTEYVFTSGTGTKANPAAGHG
jgi:hypothetical protein